MGRRGWWENLGESPVAGGVGRECGYQEERSGLYSGSVDDRW